MIENYQQQKELEQNEPASSDFANIGVFNYSTRKATLIFDGQTTATTKQYKCNSAIAFTAGQRVKIFKVDGTYIIEYPILNN